MSPEDPDDLGTAEKAKPMWGEALYQRRARQAFSHLVRLARDRKTETYGQFAKRLKMRSPRNLNYVLGSVGASLLVLSQAWGRRIPPIETLVVNAEKESPGPGVDHFLSSLAGPVPAEREARVRYAQEQVFDFAEWDAVQAALRGPPPVRNTDGAATDSGAPAAPSTPTRGSDAAANAYWWVNRKLMHRQEVEGEVEYLWSPKVNQNGARNVSYDNMVRVMPGDVVFSFADAAIRAVGVALGRAPERRCSRRSSGRRASSGE